MIISLFKQQTTIIRAVNYTQTKPNGLTEVEKDERTQPHWILVKRKRFAAIDDVVVS